MKYIGELGRARLRGQSFYCRPVEPDLGNASVGTRDRTVLADCQDRSNSGQNALPALGKAFLMSGQEEEDETELPLPHHLGYIVSVVVVSLPTTIANAND